MDGCCVQEHDHSGTDYKDRIIVMMFLIRRVMMKTILMMKPVMKRVILIVLTVLVKIIVIIIQW